MARKPTGNPNGAPPKEIDWKSFEDHCAIMCTQSEIASFLKIDENTLRSRVEEHYGDSYSVIYKRFQETGKCSLRRNQYVMSQNNASMAIWLGKQYLGQMEPQNEKQEKMMNAIVNLLAVVNDTSKELVPEKEKEKNDVFVDPY